MATEQQNIQSEAAAKNALRGTAESNAPTILSIEDVWVEYRTPGGWMQAVRGVTLDIRQGEAVALIGESGSGKSTLGFALLRMLVRTARVSKGKATYRDSHGNTLDLFNMKESEFRKFRWQECAMVFQAAQNSLNPFMHVSDTFYETARAHGVSNRHEVRDRTHDLLRMVQLDADRVYNAYPFELSGGMRQRVSIALALLLEPQLLILDEPTTALDILTQRAIIDLLKELRDKLGFSMIFISHDLSIAAELADRMLTMYAGRVVERAKVDDMFYRPRHPYSVGLLRAVPRVSGTLGKVVSIPGSPPDLIRLPPGCAYAPRCPFVIDACREAEPPLIPVDTPEHDAACIRWQDVAETLRSDDEIPVAEKLA